MTDNLKNRVKEIAAEVSENPDEIKFIKAGTSLIIPKTLSSDPSSISSGLEKGRDDDENDGSGGDGGTRDVPDTRTYDREGEGEGEEEREIDLPPDEDNPANKKQKEKKDSKQKGEGEDEDEGDEEGDEEGKGKKKEGDEEEEGDQEGEGKGKGKGKGKKKKGKKGPQTGGDDDDEDDGDDEDEDEDEDQDQDQQQGPPKKRKLKKGDKVIIKNKMVVGKVVKVNTDGTYQVEETDENISDLPFTLADGGTLKDDSQPETGVPVEVMANGAVLDDVADVNVIDLGNAPIGKEIPIIKAPGTVGDYEEDELEIVGKPQKPPKNPPTTPPPPPPPPKPTQLPDYSQLLDKIEMLKLSKFRLPALGKFFFNSELNADTMFYKYQAPLVLNNRLARVVFNKKRVMPDSDAQKYREFVISYPNFLDFCTNCLEYQVDGFYLPADKPFTPALDLDASVLSSRFSGPKGLVDIINNEMMKAAKELEPLSLNQIQQMLETAMQRGDKPYMLPIGKVNRGIVAQIYLDFIENELVKDYQFYRILSLTAFIKPDYFDDQNWLKTHLDYFFNYFRNNELGFSNLPGAAFRPQIRNEDLYSMMKKNLNIYNIIRANTTDSYKVYVFDNMRTMDPSLPDSRVNFSIKTITELSGGGKITDDLCRELINFYQFSTTLRLDYSNKESVLFNLQKLANLQKESYETLLSDIDLQIKIYGV